MSRSYHVNPGSGQVNRCKARVSCPFGGDQAHYPTVEEAQSAYEAMAGTIVRKHAELHRDFLATEGRLERVYAQLKAVRNRIVEGKAKDGDVAADLRKLARLEQAQRRGIREVRAVWYDRELAYREAVDAGLIDPAAQRPNSLPKFARRANAIAGRTLRVAEASFEAMTPAYRASAVEELAAWRGISREEAAETLDSYTEDMGVSEDQFGVALFQAVGEPKRQVFVDLETSNFHSSQGEIIEIGIVVVEDGVVVEEIAERFDLERPDVKAVLGTGNQAVHKIAPEDIEGLPTFRDPKVQARMGKVLNDPEAVLIAHHNPFEMSWLSQELDGFYSARDPQSARNIGRKLKKEPIPLNGDTRSLSAFLLHSSSSNKLESFTQANGVPYLDAHTAIVDSRMTQKAHVAFREALASSKAGQRPDLTYEGMPAKKVREKKD